VSLHTGNTVVVKRLQDALQDFLGDHRSYSEKHDAEWIEDWKNMTDEEKKNYPGCGCEDCTTAGQLLGNIY
jgi:hypothetical protein